MNIKLWQNIPVMPLALMGFMAATRLGHFGTTFSLPDASLAVFFFAGFGMNGLGFFALLLLEAGLIDYLAISQFGVSDFCITPAYLFLIPTYAVMWLAGRYCVALAGFHFSDSLKTFALASVATSIAFLISNGSFYLLSGSFGVLSVAKYAQQLAHYYPPYAASALVYIAIGLVLYKAGKSIHLTDLVRS